ncbi:type I-G CRISPR-associated protein Csb2 [Halorhodospira neutriphila]|uniref:type I-G CRISPR-associated protein Csb2 n=1 Tax=Halorhodospira neutriphila TaxID=168379 RepID=UPI003B8330D2
MPILHLTVHWLADAPGQPSYHGEEWPPSPARLFRALLAGACQPGGAGQRGVAALQRLESLEPPVILGPAPERLAPVRTSVPNNDGDQVMDAHHRGRPAQARRRESKLRTMRLRQPWSVPGPVEYRWHCPEPDPDPAAFDLLAEGLTLLGQGADLATATARWQEVEEPRWGYQWAPDSTFGAELMAVPRTGEVDRLEAAYQQSRQRIRGGRVAGVAEPPATRVAYRDPLAPPALRFQAFNLRLPDDSGPLAVPGGEAMRVAGMTRHAVHEAARLSGLDEATIAGLLGHGDPEQRLYIAPVPNVAHQWADGRVRRVLIAASPALPQAVWDAVLLRLTAAELIDRDRRSEAKGLLTPVPRLSDDKLLWRFLEKSTSWTAASPVVLPGFDTRRGKPRPAKAARRLLRYAGIPEEAVRRIHLNKAPSIPGVCSTGGVEVPHYLSSYPRLFPTLEFHQPVTGPLLLGAGAGAGLGLLTHG